MTHFEADAKIKDRFGPFAQSLDSGELGPYRYYVGACPFHGKGATWEEAFANIHSAGLNVRRRQKVPRGSHKCCFCRRPHRVATKSTR